MRNSIFQSVAKCCILLGLVNFSYGKWETADLKKVKSILVYKKNISPAKRVCILGAADFTIVTTDVPDQIHGYMVSKDDFEKKLKLGSSINYEDYTYSVHYGTENANEIDDLCISPTFTSVLAFRLVNPAGMSAESKKNVEFSDSVNNATTTVDGYFVQRMYAGMTFLTLLVPTDSLKSKNFTYRKGVSASLGGTTLPILSADENAKFGTTRQDANNEQQYMDAMSFIVLTPTVNPPVDPPQ